MGLGMGRVSVSRWGELRMVVSRLLPVSSKRMGRNGWPQGCQWDPVGLEKDQPRGAER